MHDDDLWQVYSNNGTPIEGRGASKQGFNENKDLIMGNAHVWFWKTDGTRDSSKKNFKEAAILSLTETVDPIQP